MNILYIGWKVNEEAVQEYSGASVAGNKYESGIIKNLEGGENNLCLLISLPYALFPGTKKIFVGKKDCKNPPENTEFVSYINLPFIKQLSISLSLIHKIIKWAFKHRKEKDKVIVTYNVFYRAYPIKLAAKLFKIPRVLVIADVLPKNTGGLKKLDLFAEKNEIKRYDGLMPITDLIAKDYAPGKAFLRVEGGIHKPVEFSPFIYTNPKTVILYTGALDDISGITNLLEAIKLIDSDKFEFHIAGRGKYADSVQEAAKSCDNIKFFGFVSPQKALELQQTADVLICPRLPDGDITRYTFPSKLMEYLSTGKTVITYHLEGIPEEYDEFLTYPAENTVEAICDAINNCTLNDESAQKRQIDFINGKQWLNYKEKINSYIKQVVNRT